MAKNKRMNNPIVKTDIDITRKGNKTYQKTTTTRKNGNSSTTNTITTNNDLNRNGWIRNLSAIGIIGLTFFFFVIGPYISPSGVISDWESNQYNYNVVDGFPKDSNNMLIIPDYTTLGVKGVEGYQNGLTFLTSISNVITDITQWISRLIGVRDTYTSEYYLMGDWYQYDIQGSGFTINGYRYDLYANNDQYILYDNKTYGDNGQYLLKKRVFWFIYSTDVLSNADMLQYKIDTNDFTEYLS